MTTKTQATIEDLYRVPENGKAEIVNGELILMPPTGDLPSRAAFNIASSLREFARGKNMGEFKRHIPTHGKTTDSRVSDF